MASKSVGFGSYCVCTCCDLGARVGRGDANEAGGGGAGGGAAEARSGVDRGDGGVGADGGGEANAIVGVVGAWCCGSGHGVEAEGGTLHEATGWVV